MLTKLIFLSQMKWPWSEMGAQCTNRKEAGSAEDLVVVQLLHFRGDALGCARIKVNQTKSNLRKGDGIAITTMIKKEAGCRRNTARFKSPIKPSQTRLTLNRAKT